MDAGLISRRFAGSTPLGSIILDFYCPSARLVVEVDGARHWDDDARAKDTARDRWLERQGVAVLRIPASQVYHDLTEVADGVLRIAEARIAAERQQMGPAPSTVRSAADGSPPAASRGR